MRTRVFSGAMAAAAAALLLLLLASASSVIGDPDVDDEAESRRLREEQRQNKHKPEFADCEAYSEIARVEEESARGRTYTRRHSTTILPQKICRILYFHVYFFISGVVGPAFLH